MSTDAMDAHPPAHRQKLILALEDGRAFFGFGTGPSTAAGVLEVEGELVFCTGMTGYQELCTDPSYRGQIVVLTYPLIDNYGINKDDFESTRPWLHGLIVREYCSGPSNWRANGQLAEWLAESQIPVAEGFDTRALTRHLRTHGALRAVLGAPRAEAMPDQDGDGGAWLMGRTEGIQGEVDRLVKRARHIPQLSEQALVAQVSGPEFEKVDQSVWAPWVEPKKASASFRVVLIDCGVKHNIARSLTRRGLDVQIVPYDATTEQIMALQPDGVVIGNGPGDPDGDPSLRGTIQTLRELLEGPVKERRMPLTAVCLGHQVMGLAIGAETARLKFGHRGANHPVKDLKTGRVYITSQNHGFHVDGSTIPAGSGFVVSHVNLNDGSVEGLAHKELPVFTVQYHPEASPGPQDNQYLFDRFVDELEASRRG